MIKHDKTTSNSKAQRDQEPSVDSVERIHVPQWSQNLGRYLLNEKHARGEIITGTP